MTFKLKKTKQSIDFLNDEIIGVSGYKLCNDGSGEWRIHLKGGSIYEITGSTKEYDKILTILLSRNRQSAQNYLDVIDNYKRGL